MPRPVDELAFPQRLFGLRGLSALPPSAALCGLLRRLSCDFLGLSPLVAKPRRLDRLESSGRGLPQAEDQTEALE
jgi:hypothetical protein